MLAYIHVKCSYRIACRNNHARYHVSSIANKFDNLPNLQYNMSDQMQLQGGSDSLQMASAIDIRNRCMRQAVKLLSHFQASFKIWHTYAKT